MKTLQEVYKNSSDEVKEILKARFSCKELGLTIDQEEFNCFFKELLSSFEIIRFLDENGNESLIPTYHFELLDKNKYWLFVISGNPEKPSFWFSSSRILPKFEEKFNCNYSNLKILMQPVLKEVFKLEGVIPSSSVLPNLSIC